MNVWDTWEDDDWEDSMNDETEDWRAEQAYYDSLDDDSFPADLWPDFDAPEAAAYAARWTLAVVIGLTIAAAFTVCGLCR